MASKYNIAIPANANDSPVAKALRQTLYQVMYDLKRSTGPGISSIPIRDLNNKAMNITRNKLFEAGVINHNTTTQNAPSNVLNASNESFLNVNMMNDGGGGVDMNARPNSRRRQPLTGMTGMTGMTGTSSDAVQAVHRGREVLSKDRELYYNNLLPQTTIAYDATQDKSKTRGSMEAFESMMRDRSVGQDGAPPLRMNVTNNNNNDFGTVQDRWVTNPSVRELQQQQHGQGGEQGGQGGQGALRLPKELEYSDVGKPIDNSQFDQMVARLQKERFDVDEQQHNQNNHNNASSSDQNMPLPALSSSFDAKSMNGDIDYEDVDAVDAVDASDMLDPTDLQKRSMDTQARLQGGIHSADPKTLFSDTRETFQSHQDGGEDGEQHRKNVMLAVSGDAADESIKPQMILPPIPNQNLPMKWAITENYVAINGFDRDYAKFPYRYRFDVLLAAVTDTTGANSAYLRDTYKNVAWMEATCLIIPMDVLGGGTSVGGATSAGSTSLVYKPHYTYSFGLACQYVTLRLDGFEGAYDGTNDVLRRAIGLFTFDRSYQAPNGRGYVVLRPMQPARRRFLTPLASMRSLTLSITQPMNMLMNNSTDEYTVVSMHYETSNKLFLKFVCGEYFDGNEFYIGDHVILRDFEIEPPVGETHISPYASLQEFINRPEGHEVVQLGIPNEQGFYNTFYVLAPGVLDQGRGRIVLDQNIISAINALGDPNNPASVSKPGRLLNASLQITISMTIGTVGPAFPTPVAQLQQMQMLSRGMPPPMPFGAGSTDNAPLAANQLMSSASTSMSMVPDITPPTTTSGSGAPAASPTAATT